MKTSYALVLASAIILTLGAIPAQAITLSNRTFVSGTTGADTGTCPITAPCASFSYALSQTVAGGEIDCLTPGDFGGSGQGVTITKSVSIVCDGVSNGGILNTNSGGPTISINAGSGAVVYLSGLDLNGLAFAGAIGVEVLSGSTVYIAHCKIRSFADYGVSVFSSTNPTRVFIKDSIIVNNRTGVLVEAQSSATNAAIIVNTVIDGNSSVAAGGDNDSGTSVLALENTVLSGSPTGLGLGTGASAELIGPSNTIAGAITGTTTSVAFK